MIRIMDDDGGNDDFVKGNNDPDDVDGYGDDHKYELG